MTTRSLLDRKVQLAFGFVVFTLLIVGVISFRRMVVSAESERPVRHTHQVLESLQDLLFIMKSIESDYCGFTLTGSEKYVESFNVDTLRWPQDLATLRHPTVDDSAQQRQLTELDRLANQQIAFGEKVIVLRRSKGLQAAADFIGEGDGQRIMDEFYPVLRQILDENLTLATLRNANTKRSLRQTKTVLILATVLGLLTATAAAWSAQRGTLGCGSVEEALRDSESKDSGAKYHGLLEAAPDAMWS